MKTVKIIFGVFPLAFLLLFSCKKDTHNNPNNGGDGTGGGGTNPSNPFGVIVNDLGGGANVQNLKVSIATSLKAKYVRNAIIMQTWTGSDNYTDALLAANFKLVTNINWGTPGTGPVPFPKAVDMANYQNTLTAILNKYQPSLIAIENEEVNANYHSGSILDYLNELNTAIPIVHSKGLKITNGGITERPLNILVWKDYYNRGMLAEANSYALRTMPPSIISDLPDLNNHALLQYLSKQADTLVNGLATANIDYINFHWYEPVMERNNGGNPVADTTQVDTKALEESIAYLQRKTGKTVITNETGELHISPGIVTNMMQKYYDLKLPYVIWYDGDGSGGAKALNNLDGTLRPNGQAFINFITQHY